MARVRGTAILGYVGDFRAAATDASSLDGAPAGGSHCLRIENPDPADRRIRRDFIVSGVVGAAGEALGVVLVMAGVAFAQAAIVGAGVLIFFAGAACSIVEVPLRTFRTRRLLRRRGTEPPPDAWGVSIEDALTFTNLKLGPDDLGMMWVDSSDRALLIEGLTHRYRVRFVDVTEIGVRRALCVTCTSIAYRVNGVELVLAVSENQVNPIEIIKQTLGRRPRLYFRIAKVVAAAQTPATPNRGSFGHFQRPRS